MSLLLGHEASCPEVGGPPLSSPALRAPPASPQTSNSSTTWGLLRNAGSQAPNRPPISETMGVWPINLCLNKPSRGLRTTDLEKALRLNPVWSLRALRMRLWHSFFTSSLGNAYAHPGLGTIASPLPCWESKAHLYSQKAKRGRSIVFIRDWSGGYKE